LLTVTGALIASRAITMSPMDSPPIETDMVAL